MGHASEVPVDAFQTILSCDKLCDILILRRAEARESRFTQK
jgi:hypothetical protein